MSELNVQSVVVLVGICLREVSSVDRGVSVVIQEILIHESSEMMPFAACISPRHGQVPRQLVFNFKRIQSGHRRPGVGKSAVYFYAWSAATIGVWKSGCVRACGQRRIDWEAEGRVTGSYFILDLTAVK